jgi:hypothetical protein
MTADHPGTTGTPNLKISFVPNISEVTVHTSLAKSVKTSHVSHKYGTYNKKNTEFIHTFRNFAV